MKLLACLLMLLCVNFADLTEPEITEIRTLYDQAANDKASADKLMELLAATQEKSIPVLICYKGAAEMMQAKYGKNPLNKLKRFRNGKILIEKAIKRNPYDIEMRFLRFSVQTNLPSFLGYKDQINEDKFFLIAKLNTVKDNDLKQRAVKYLSSSKYCSEEERNRIEIVQ